MKYKITLSNKEQYVVDEVDYNKILQNIGEPFIKIAQAVINPAFIISMKEDEEAVRDLLLEKRNEETLKLISKPMELTVEDIKKYRPDFVKEALGE